jgi:dephospho-CoA kinase
MCYGSDIDTSCAMLRVGLTGGIATGKSTVSRLFVECGARLVDADVLAHEAVQPGRPALREIVATFGPGMLCPDGTLNRPRLAEVVFKDAAQRERLEAIVHPYVFLEEDRLSREIAAGDPHAVILFDAALLIETGAHKFKDRVIVVTADTETQIQRLMARDGMSAHEARRRIESQMPLSDKVKLADYNIPGTIPIKSLTPIVQRIYAELQGLALSSR